MKVLVVCRYNQARSIVIGAMIRKLFPQIDVVTAGIEAPHGKGIPGSTEALCREWNLPQFDRISIAIEKLEIEHFDAVLALDDYVFEALLSRVQKSKIKSIYDFETQEVLLPIDPSGMNYLNFKFEIAKAIILALRWVNSLINCLPKNIDSFWFSNIKHAKTWLNSSEAQKYSVLIDTNVISPQWEIWSTKERKLERLNFRQISGGELDFDNLSSSIAIASKYEVDRPGELFLSSQWLDFLERLSSIGPIGIFGIAEIELGNLWNAEFFLGLAHSSRTIFIK